MSSQIAIDVDEIEIYGDLERIPSLLEADKKPSLEKPLFNAENLTITDEGQVFATGSLAVHEIVKDNKGIYQQQQEIPITAHDVPRDCLMNGITAQGNSLYLACAHIHKGDHSLLPNLFGDIRKIDQNSDVLLLLLAKEVYQVDSYIIRADLEHQSLSFSEGIKLPGKCFANGLDGDRQGNLYTANPDGIFSSSLLKVRFPNGCGTTTMGAVWHRPLDHGRPNGLKIRGDYVYYTCLHGLPIRDSTLQRVRIMPDGSAGEVEIIHKSSFSIFDDFDVVDNGFVITNIMSIPYLSGSLLFIDNNGRLIGIFKNKDLKSPSSVKVVKKSQLFKEGDILITEKGRHCVSCFQPENKWRSWLTGSST